MNRFEHFEDVDIPIEDHHKHPALGSTRLRTYIEDVKLPGDKARSSMDIGTAVHVFVLDPDNRGFVKRKPKFSGEGSVRARNDWMEENQGFLILTQYEYDLARAMADSLMSTPAIRKVLSHPKVQVEHTVIATTDTRIACKARPDIRVPGVLQVDIKTTRAVDDQAFARSFSDRGYDLQSAFYADVDRDRYGVKQIKYWVAAVRNFHPFRVSYERVTEEWLDTGRKLYESAITAVEYERDRNERPPLYFEGDHQMLPPPPWVSSRAERIRDHAQRLVAK